jgi:hypothetical protein
MKETFEERAARARGFIEDNRERFDPVLMHVSQVSEPFVLDASRGEILKDIDRFLREADRLIRRYPILDGFTRYSVRGLGKVKASLASGKGRSYQQQTVIHHLADLYYEIGGEVPSAFRPQKAYDKYTPFFVHLVWAFWDIYSIEERYQLARPSATRRAHFKKVGMLTVR